VYGVQDISTMFYLPLSTAAFEELNLVKSLMVEHTVSDQKDEC
jgi:hypothetical protein